jgi:hypothetical protein
MSRGIKLVLMGVAGAALLYSCAPTMIGGSGFLWALPWLFRGGGSSVTAPATPGQTATKPTTGDDPEPARRLRLDGQHRRLIRVELKCAAKQ